MNWKQIGKQGGTQVRLKEKTTGIREGLGSGKGVELVPAVAIKTVTKEFRWAVKSRMTSSLID